jgi:hypothetical protein
MKRINEDLSLEEYLDQEIEKCNTYPDDYSSGAMDALLRVKLHIETVRDKYKDLVSKYPNDADLGKAVRKLILKI